MFESPRVGGIERWQPLATLRFAVACMKRGVDALAETPRALNIFDVSAETFLHRSHFSSISILLTIVRWQPHRDEEEHAARGNIRVEAVDDILRRRFTIHLSLPLGS